MKSVILVAAVLGFFGTAKAQNSCESLFGSSPRLGLSDRLAHMPSDIRPLFLEATLSQMNLGRVDQAAGRPFSDWTEYGILNLRAMGLPEREVQFYMSRLGERFAEKGRGFGLSEPIRNQETMTEAQGSDLTIPARYRLGAVLKKYQDLAIRFPGVHEYQGSMAYAMSLAERSGNVGLLNELVRQNMRLGNPRAVPESVPGSSEMNYEFALIWLGQYYLQTLHTNTLSVAIGQLADVQGPMRAKAQVLLREIADELVSKAHFQTMLSLKAADPRASTEAEKRKLRLNLHEYALKTLLKTAEKESRTVLGSDSPQTFLVLRDPAVIQKVQTISDEIFKITDGNLFIGDSRIVLQALSAIGDKTRLNHYAEILLATAARHAKLFGQETGQRNFPVEDTAAYGVAIDYFLVAENKGRLIELKGAEPKRPSPVALTNSNGTPENTYAKMTLDSETWIRSTILHSQLLTAQQRAQTLAEAQDDLENGRVWEAYQAYAAVADRNGLIRTATMMLRAGDGLNALNPLRFAAMLKP